MKKEKIIEKQEEEFYEIASKIAEKEDLSSLSDCDELFIYLFLASNKDQRIRLFQALPETIEHIMKYWEFQNKEMEKQQEDREDLIAILEEYLRIFKNKKEHQKAHKNQPCPKCKLTREMIRKLKNEKENNK